MSDFYINNYSNTDGPSIFSNRLKIELENQGHKFNDQSYNRLLITNGNIVENKFNILRLDGLYLDSGNTLGPNEELNRPIFECYKKSDHIIFQSEYARNVYEAFTGEKKSNSIIYNGVEDIFFTNNESIDKPYGFEKVVIASSKWRRHKRIEECIEAFKDKRLKDVALVILGGYSNVDLPNVFSLPMINPVDLPRYYKMADVMIHLCWLDCCPNSVVEALACGVPVVCSHNGGTNELVKQDGVILKLEEDYEYGSLVDLYNPPKVSIDSIVDGVIKCLDIKQINPRLDLNISNTAKQYSSLFKNE
jgi:glycosyltransferase involved in cell wall biosynthesis